MSWGFIPGNLVSEAWENQTEGPIGMNTSSESQQPSAEGENVSVAKWGPSLSKTESLLRLAITALQEAVEAASRVHAHAQFQESSPEVRTIPAPEAVSRFMQRLTHYCALLESNVMELSSIAPKNPAEDAPSSLEEQELESSSLREVEPISISDRWNLPVVYEEPGIGSAVLDNDDDIWVRTNDGWNCAFSTGQSYNEWSWAKLQDWYTVRLILKA